MSAIFTEYFPQTDNFDPALLRELIHDDYLPELIDPAAEISEADWEDYHADMQATPMDLPTAEEVLAMAKSLGLDEPPF